jgi:hypothetical protein
VREFPAFPLLDSTNWPSFPFIHEKLSKSGFYFGESSDDYEPRLAGIAPDLTSAALTSPTPEFATLYRCAWLLLNICDAQTRVRQVQSTSLAEVASGVLVGPKQLYLLQQLEQKGFAPGVIAGYRSPAFQALVFAARYLSGTLLDSFGRYTAAPPGWSDHHVLDGALDLDNSLIFIRGLLETDQPLPLSLFQPYLYDPVVAYEPWHWRTLNIETKLDALKPRGCLRGEWTRSLSSVLAALNPEPLGSDTSSQEHTFALGISSLGHSVCIGSYLPTLSRTIADALDAIGSGWNAKYLSVPTGYTPIFDNQIQPHDIGRCIFKIRPRRGGTSAYLTGAGCIAYRVLTPADVAQELLAKVKGSPSEEYRLEKTKTSDLLILQRSHPLPAAHGLPVNPFERDTELPILLSHDYCKWLAHGTRNGFPIYFSADYGRTYSSFCDPMRYALLLAFLTRYAAVLPISVSTTSEHLLNVFGRGTFGRLYRAGGASTNDPIPEATCVFIAQALCYAGQGEMLEELWTSQYARLKRYVAAIMRHDTDPNGWLFMGHLCQLAGEVTSIPTTQFYELGLTSSRLKHLIARSSLSILHANACAQMIRYLYSHDDVDRFAQNEAEALICRLLTAEPSVIEEEEGAFAGLESFQSSLPAEAMLNLRQILPIAAADDALVLARVARVARFLRRLQFQPGSGAMSPQPSLVEGAVRYSLMDHHFRIDYGIHASAVAVQFCLATGLL